MVIELVHLFSGEDSAKRGLARISPPLRNFVPVPLLPNAAVRLDSSVLHPAC